MAALHQHKDRENDQPPATNQRPYLRSISIGKRDYLTTDDILEVFRTDDQYYNEHIMPIKQQISDWWRVFRDFAQSEAFRFPLDDLLFTHEVRHVLFTTRFVTLPPQVHRSHMQWNSLLPFLEDARYEIKRTQGYLALLTQELGPYESAWKAFWSS